VYYWIAVIKNGVHEKILDKNSKNYKTKSISATGRESILEPGEYIEERTFFKMN
jgi:hypothetical protein